MQAARLLSNSYSGELLSLSIPAAVAPEAAVPAGSEEHGGNRQPLWPAPLYRIYVGLGVWRRPLKKGGSVLWLVVGWAFAWIVFAVIAASLILPVLEMIHRLR